MFLDGNEAVLRLLRRRCCCRRRHRRDPRPPRNDRQVPRRAPRQRDRRDLVRHQPGASPGASRSRSRPASPGSVVACSRSARSRRTTAMNFSPFLGLFWVVLVVTLGCPHGRRRDPGRARVRALPGGARAARTCRRGFQFVLFGLDRDHLRQAPRRASSSSASADSSRRSSAGSTAATDRLRATGG